MADLTCVCGRKATHVRWGAKSRGDAYDGVRIPCCAFHHVYPDGIHPFDIDAEPDWPTALETA